MSVMGEITLKKLILLETTADLPLQNDSLQPALILLEIWIRYVPPMFLGGVLEQ